MKSSNVIVQHPKQISYFKILWMASRPKALIISWVTVGVSNLLAYRVLGRLDTLITILTLLFSIFIQIGMHFINDAIDFEEGIDNQDRIGFPKVTQLGLATAPFMHRSGLVCLGLAFLLGLPLIWQGGWFLFPLFLICVANGYLYTGGPLPLSYTGLGDLCSFLFFGLVSAVAVYYLQTGEMDVRAFLLGSQSGCLATVLTALNNLRDIYSDAKAHKKTLAVRFGKTFARIEITCLLLFPFLLSLFWIHFGYSWASFLPYLTFPLAYQLAKLIWTKDPSPEYNKLFKLGIALQVLFSLLLAIGFFIR